MPLEAAKKAKICSAGQASPWFVSCWSLISLILPILYVSSLLPSALCIHGNSCLLWSTTGNQHTVLIIIILGNICQSLSFVDQWEWGFTLDCIPLCTRAQILEWGWHPFLTLIDWVTRFICCTEYSCLWLCLWWQFLTKVFMVLGTVLTLHRSTHLIMLIDCCIWYLWVC